MLVDPAVLAITSITCIFECFAIYIVFLAYREFKGMEYDATGGGGMPGGLGGGVVGRAAQTTGTDERQRLNDYNGNGTNFSNNNGGGGGGSAGRSNQNF